MRVKSCRPPARTSLDASGGRGFTTAACVGQDEEDKAATQEPSRDEFDHLELFARENNKAHAHRTKQFGGFEDHFYGIVYVAK